MQQSRDRENLGLMPVRRIIREGIFRLGFGFGMLCGVLIILAIMELWGFLISMEHRISEFEVCPDWFVSYVQYDAKLMETEVPVECVWNERPDFILDTRGRIVGITYPQVLENDIIREQVAVAFSSFDFGLLKGKERGRIEVFDTPVTPEGEHATNFTIDGNAIYFDLNVEDLLERNWGRFVIVFGVERPIRSDERELLVQPYRLPSYNLEVVVEESGETLIFTVRDPREHLFYSRTAYRGTTDVVPFWVDKWYGEGGEVTRMVATRAE